MPSATARPPIQLRLIHADSTLICEVYDTSNTAPHLRRARTFDEGGRGLLLVAQLAQRWGTRHAPIGKTVWAEQALPGQLVRARRRSGRAEHGSLNTDPWRASLARQEAGSALTVPRAG